MNTLIGIAYSPWSQQAKWALDHHNIAYQYKEYLPMLGATALRVKRKRWRGPVTVPVLLSDTGVIDDSLDIARYADQKGKAAPLFPKAHEAQILQWEARLDKAKQAGRQLTTAKTARDSQALLGMVPPPLRKGPVGPLFGKLGVQYVTRKYHISGQDEQAARAVMRDALQQAWQTLQQRDTLVGQFSYADISLAMLLQFVDPVDHPTLRLSRRSRTTWVEPQLAEDFAKLLAWRDGLFQNHRDTPG